MYGGILPWFCATDAQTAMWLFWTRILAWKPKSAIFLHGEVAFSWKFKNFEFICRLLCCRGFERFFNSLLGTSKQTKLCTGPQSAHNSFVFYRNYIHYTKCKVIWGSAPFERTQKLKNVLFCFFPLKVELPLWKAKNKNFRLKLKEKLPFRCFLFDVNWSFRSKVTVENVTFQSKIACYISYVFYCFLKLLFLIFFTLKN